MLKLRAQNPINYQNMRGFKLLHGLVESEQEFSTGNRYWHPDQKTEDDIELEKIKEAAKIESVMTSTTCILTGQMHASKTKSVDIKVPCTKLVMEPT